MKRICEQCGAELLDGAKYCTNCGKEYKEEKMCPNCNAPIKDGAKFCTKCGCNLEKSVKGKRNIGKWIKSVIVRIRCISFTFYCNSNRSDMGSSGSFEEKRNMGKDE